MRIRNSLVTAALCSGAFILSGCATGADNPNLTKIDDTIASQPVQTGIQLVCAGLTGAKAGWDTYLLDHSVSDADQNKADAAYAGAQALCAGDTPQNTADAVQKVVAATVAVITALHAEQGGQAASAAE